MIYVLDANAISDLMDQRPVITGKTQSALYAGHVVATSIIVRGEILFGIERLSPGRRRSALETSAATMFAGLPCITLPLAAAKTYASIKAARRNSGIAMNENDLWIAATTIQVGGVLISRDNDFSGTPGLAIEDWSK